MKSNVPEESNIPPSIQALMGMIKASVAKAAEDCTCESCVKNKRESIIRHFAEEMIKNAPLESNASPQAIANRVFALAEAFVAEGERRHAVLFPKDENAPANHKSSE